MRRGHLAGIVMILLSTVPPGVGLTESTDDTLEVRKITLTVRHRVYADFREGREVKLLEKFQIGDTEFSARALRFVPDFAMNLEKRTIISRSNEPRNPAFQIVVMKGAEPQDTSWAFFNMPPHFGRKSLLSFQVMRIDFKSHDPMIAPDSMGSEGRGQ